MRAYSASARPLVVGVVGLLVFSSITVGLAGTASAAAGDDRTFAVAQGSSCYEVDPYADADRTVSAFYDYRNPNTTPSASTYSSYGTTEFQRTGESSLLLYAGPDDTSLVVLHDRLGDGDGGSTTTYDIEGLPDGEWAVQDDIYANRDDEWDLSDGRASIDWKWSINRTDGGAYRGLDSLEGPIVIDPSYNEDADAWGEWGYSGTPEYRVTDWTVFDADGDEHTLDLDRRVFIHPGGCVETPPSAALSAPGTAAVDESVTLDAGDTTDPDDEVAAYEWDLDGDGETDRVTDSPTVEYAFEAAGNRSVSVTALDTYGNGDTASVTVEVADANGTVEPTASLSAPESVPPNETVTLDASDSEPTDEIGSYAWDVDGDGTVENTTADPSITIAYEDTGEYEPTVTVTVTGEEGSDASDTASTTITVADDPPTAILSVPTEASVNETVTLDASDSVDDVGIDSYAWDFEGDGDVDRVTDSPTVEHAYDASGQYEPSVVVNDTRDASDTATGAIDVTGGDDGDDGDDGDGGDDDGDDEEAVARLTVTTPVEVGEPATLNASASTGDVEAFAWDVDGDGEDERTTESPVVEHEYSAAGEYPARVTLVLDDEGDAGANGTATATVVVEGSEPAVDVDLSVPSEATVSTPVTLTADATGIDENATYEWDLDGGDAGNGTVGSTVTVTYDEPEEYDPTVTVTDEQNGTATATETVNVTRPDPEIDADATQVGVGTSVGFDAVPSFDDGAPYSLRWDFGDGANDTGNAVEHAYKTNGTYTVTLNLLVENESVASADTRVTVTDADDGDGSGDDGDGSNDGGTGSDDDDRDGSDDSDDSNDSSNDGGDDTDDTGDGGSDDTGAPAGGGGGGGSGGGGGGGGSSDDATGGTDDADGESDADPDPEPNLTAVTASIDSESIVAGESVVVTASVTNEGNASGTKTIELEIDDEEVAIRRFTLSPNESRTVRFTREFADPGTYTIEVDTTQEFRVAVRPPEPNVSVVGLTANDSDVGVGEAVTFTARVRNDGEAAGTIPVRLSLFNETVATREVRVEPGATTRVEFTRRIAAPGQFRAVVGNHTVTVTVAGDSTPDAGGDTGGDDTATETTTPGFGVLAALAGLAALVATLAGARRRRE
ncbi:PKD domain-containing protein (plasmid) [Halobaculum sp. CBA1158]|uniref:PKD domain-containing protein n=1 Tax=Halobaculum sp. CBA1158 TaxID=2904243 RepID=UPI001F26B784|nr:PKD domain-containing protein [Halobaculum sp. CBA1158]UIP01543.1 PKD domain-containing protein [Halobaculum sp. CBA1158]